MSTALPHITSSSIHIPHHSEDFYVALQDEKVDYIINGSAVEPVIHPEQGLLVARMNDCYHTLSSFCYTIGIVNTLCYSHMVQFSGPLSVP